MVTRGRSVKSCCSEEGLGRKLNKEDEDAKLQPGCASMFRNSVLRVFLKFHCMCCTSVSSGIF